MDQTTYNRKRRQFKELKLVGVSDIADMLEWDNLSRVTQYYKRGRLPEPIGTIGKRPVWLKDQVIPFVEEMKRKDR